MGSNWRPQRVRGLKPMILYCSWTISRIKDIKFQFPDLESNKEGRMPYRSLWSSALAFSAVQTESRSCNVTPQSHITDFDAGNNRSVRSTSRCVGTEGWTDQCRANGSYQRRWFCFNMYLRYVSSVPFTDSQSVGIRFESPSIMGCHELSHVFRRSWFPAWDGNFSLRHRIQTCSGVSFPGGKAARAWSWPLTSI
jgi:hypothetical protein